MSDHITTVDNDNFDQEVNSSALPVLLDFWAPWCNPCMALMPTVDALAQQYAGRLKVAKVNSDEQRVIAERFGVRGIPYLLLLHNGQAKAVLQGRTKTRLSMELDKLLA